MREKVQLLDSTATNHHGTIMYSWCYFLRIKHENYVTIIQTILHLTEVLIMSAGDEYDYVILTKYAH